MQPKNLIAAVATLVCSAVAGAQTAAPTSPIAAAATSARCQRWVDSVYATLTPRQRVAQLMCPKLIPTQGKTSQATIKRIVGENGVGSILFTEGSIAQYAEMTNLAARVARVPLLVTFDGEWGVAMRVKGTVTYPKNMTVGAITDNNLVEQYGAEVARQCRLLGINVNFAPVADVNSNPANPVIGQRSFGEDPQRVADKVVAYSRGLEKGRVQAVAKHFPGHGDTDSDSHKTLPTIKHNMKRLEKVEFLPFQAFTNAGFTGAMMGHISVPAIDRTGLSTSLGAPAYKLLRNKIGFNGLIYTDAMGMRGAVMPDSSNNTVAALAAGADVIECAHAVQDIDAVMAALKSGRISAKTVEDRCRRVLAYKYALAFGSKTPVDTANLAARLNSPEAVALCRRMYASAMTVVYNNNDVLPLRNLDKRNIAVVCLGDDPDGTFAAYCQRYARVKVINAPKSELSAADMAQLKKYNTVIVAVFNNKPATCTAYSALAKQCKGMITAFCVNPYKAVKVAGAKKHGQAMVMAYEDVPYAAEYAVQTIFGGIGAKGTLPVAMRGIAKVGAGVKTVQNRLGYRTLTEQNHPQWMADSIDSIVGHALHIDAMPGCQVLVAKDGNIVFDKAYGKLTRGGAPVTASTMYDCASVSKALGTLPGVMMAVDRGLIDVDAPASRYIPGLRGGAKEGITVRQLLYHESGMPASMNVYNAMVDTTGFNGQPIISGRQDSTHNIYISRGAWGHDKGRLRADVTSRTRSAQFPHPIADSLFVSDAGIDTMFSCIYRIPLRKNNNYNYSCLNFCLLMDAEQRVTGRNHMEWCDTNLWEPLGAWSVTYRPAEYFDKSMIAPTEYDSYLRRQTVHGYVHDETAAFSGGIQGNAGLFANADDLAKICQMWLNGGTYGDARVMGQNTVKQFTTEKSPTCRRGLGFDKPDVDNPDNSPTCAEAGREVFGHLGFTGTVFWVDPVHNLTFIFLTNRVNPTRDTPAFNSTNIRPSLYSVVCRALAK